MVKTPKTQHLIKWYTIYCKLLTYILNEHKKCEVISIRSTTINQQLKCRHLDTIVSKYDSFFYGVCVKQCISPFKIKCNIKLLSSGDIVYMCAEYFSIYHTLKVKKDRLKCDGEILQLEIFNTIYGERIVTHSFNGCIQIWNPITFTYEKTEYLYQLEKITIHMLPCRTKFVILTTNGIAIIWHFSGERIYTFTHTTQIRSLVIVGNKIVILDYLYIHIWDIKSEKYENKLDGSSITYICKYVLPDNLLVVITGNDEGKIWDPILNKFVATLEGRKTRHMSFRLFQDDLLCWIPGEYTSIQLYDIYTGTYKYFIKGYDTDNRIYDVIPFMDKYIIITSRQGTSVWNATQPKIHLTNKPDSIVVKDNAFITCDCDNFRVWR